jgi:hypothetical protein
VELQMTHGERGGNRRFLRKDETDSVVKPLSIENDREVVLDVLDVLDTRRKLKHDKWDLNVF